MEKVKEEHRVQLKTKVTNETKNLLFRFEAKIKIKVLTPALSASRFSVVHAVEKVPLLWSCQPYQESDDGFKPETGVLLPLS